MKPPKKAFFRSQKFPCAKIDVNVTQLKIAQNDQKAHENDQKHYLKRISNSKIPLKAIFTTQNDFENFKVKPPRQTQNSKNYDLFVMILNRVNEK